MSDSPPTPGSGDRNSLVAALRIVASPSRPESELPWADTVWARSKVLGSAEAILALVQAAQAFSGDDFSVMWNRQLNLDRLASLRSALEGLNG